VDVHAHLLAERPDHLRVQGLPGADHPAQRRYRSQLGAPGQDPILGRRLTFFSHYVGTEPFADEWWRTGDLVTADRDGYLWFEGRGDDVIVSSGYRIGPFEVESALLTHPAVSEAAAVAAPDPERGSVVRAVVVLRSGEPGEALAAELQEHVRAVTAPYKYPRIVEFADSLPKTASGKITRAELRGNGSTEGS
jgi:acetyl-CoA synthetase